MSATPYVTRAQILTQIPGPLLNDALDDNRDGIEDPTLFDNLVAQCSTDVDAFLAGVYQTPFTTFIPAQVNSAAFAFVCEAIYSRRPVDGKNPWATAAQKWRDRLEKIGARQLPLDSSLPLDLIAAAGSAPQVAMRIPQAAAS